MNDGNVRAIAQEAVRKAGLCGTIIRGGAAVCIRETAHRGDCEPNGPDVCSTCRDPGKPVRVVIQGDDNLPRRFCVDCSTGRR